MSILQKGRPFCRVSRVSWYTVILLDIHSCGVSSVARVRVAPLSCTVPCSYGTGIVVASSTVV